jgi:hypothetical protein
VNVVVERLYTTGDRAASWWIYFGPGIGFTPSPNGLLTGTVTIYGGVCWNVPTNTDYAGPFISFSLGAGSAVFGWAVSFFWSDGNAAQNGYNMGLTIGVPPGSPGGNWGISVGLSYITYHELSSSAWADPGPALGLLWLVPGMQIWVPFLGYKWALEKS